MNRQWPAVLVCAVLALAGCTSSTSPPTPKPADLASALAGLRDSGEALGSLGVTQDGADAFVVRDGVTQHVVLMPATQAATTSAVRVGVAPWSAFVPDAVAAQVAQLATACPAAYTVKVEAVTAKAVLASVTCPAPPAEPSGALLNGKALAQLGGFWTASDWQVALDEWAMLAPSGTLSEVRITAAGVYVQLAAAEKTNTCNPVVSRSLDGHDVSLVCMASGGPTPFTFAGVTGSDLAKAATGVMSTAGIVGGTDVEYVLASSGGHLQLSVRRGDSSGSVLVGA